MPELRPCTAPGFIARQRRDVEGLVRVALDAVREGIPYYASLSAERTAPTAEAVALAVPIVLDCWERGRMPNEEDVAAFPMVSVVEGNVMRPMQAVLRAWRIGTSAVHQELMERGAGVLTADDVAALSVVSFAWVDRVTDAVIGAHSEAARVAATTGEAEGARLRLLLSLVSGTYSSDDDIRRRARGQSLALPEPALVLVAEPLTRGQNARDALERVRAGLGLDPSSVPEFSIEGQTVLLMPPMPEDRLGPRIASRSVRVAAVSAGDLGGIASAYRTATTALRFLAGLPSSAGQLIAEADARLACLLATDLAGRQELDAIIDSLGARDSEGLVETLLAFFETGSAESAAHVIGVHPQTVRNRLRRVRERTGRDPTMGWSRFSLELAVRVRAGQTDSDIG